MKVWVKKWFFEKMQSEAGYGIHLFYSESEVSRETEKAYLLEIEYTTLDGEVDGIKKIWCPKSCIMTNDEIKAEKERFENGCNAYETMISFAKANGVKGVRTGLKKETILKKIADAGLEYNI